MEKAERAMKKFGLSFLIPGILLIFCSSTMAKKEFEPLPAPTELSCEQAIDGINDSICFDWDDVDGATKYALDVEVEVDVNEDDVADMILKFSFGTGSRTDGLPISESSLCVPLSAFVYDLDGDGNSEPVSGTATAKVKALNPPGKSNGRQNHAFFIGCTFVLP
jgi:hypothetical protein